MDKVEENVVEYSALDFSMYSLEKLELLQEKLEDHIEIMKGKESMKNHKGHTLEEIKKDTENWLKN